MLSSGVYRHQACTEIYVGTTITFTKQILKNSSSYEFSYNSHLMAKLMNSPS